jgi:hypothetical protein
MNVKRLHCASSRLANAPFIFRVLLFARGLNALPKLSSQRESFDVPHVVTFIPQAPGQGFHICERTRNGKFERTFDACDVFFHRTRANGKRALWF